MLSLLVIILKLSTYFLPDTTTFGSRTVSELTVDTHDWAEKEGDYALSKIKPFAGFAEKKNM